MQSPLSTPLLPQFVADEVFLADKAVAAMLDVCQSTVWIWTRAGKFPKPVRLAGVRCTRWRRSDVLAWMEQQVAAEPAENPGQVAQRRKRAAAKSTQATEAPA